MITRFFLFVGLYQAWQQLPPGVEEMTDERDTRLARIPPTWPLRLAVGSEHPGAAGPGVVEMEVFTPPSRSLRNMSSIAPH